MTCLRCLLRPRYGCSCSIEETLTQRKDKAIASLEAWDRTNFIRENVPCGLPTTDKKPRGKTASS